MYRIGQFRKSQLNSYSTSLTMDLDYTQIYNIMEGNITFLDVCGNLSGDNILNSSNSYYLRFGVERRIDSEQIIYLKLKNVNEEENEQLIEEFKVPKGFGIAYFETIISPNATYNQIIWELQRTFFDYRIQEGNTFGRKIVVTIESYTRLIDVLNFLKTIYTDMQYLLKIGIQGPPSLLMCINREPIRIGKTGIYEINSDKINITSISFVPKNSDNSDYFIMDFQY